jgi:cell division protein FtsN
MERNRVLWVIFSVSLFLVVVLASGLYLLRSEERKSEAATKEAAAGQGFDVFEYVRGRTNLPELEAAKEAPEELTIVVGEGEKGAGAASQSAPAPKVQLQPSQPPEQPSAAPPARSGQAPPATEAAPATTRAPARPAAPTAKPSAAAAAKPPAKPSATAAAKPAAKPSAPAAKPVSVTEYWIQLGSYEVSARAEDMARSLEEKGLAPKITTRVVGGRTYFRVRVGPYLSKAEAQKFLGWVRAVKGFESSYISMVYTRRALP